MGIWPLLAVVLVVLVLPVLAVAPVVVRELLLKFFSSATINAHNFINPKESPYKSEYIYVSV